MPDISALLNPRSIAIIGASPDATRLRGMLPSVMLMHPYPGKVYPVSRSHDEIMGLKAYAAIADVPELVDLAILVIPSHAVAEELERCGKAGVKAALIITSGFAEQSGDDGKAMQAGLREIAQSFDMAVLGPNSEGFANTALSLAATFSPAMNSPEVPLLPPWHEEGRVAVIAQSGAMGFSFFDRGRAKELPFRYVITTGNEASLEICDLVDFMLDEGKTDVFLLYLEDIKNPATFARVAEKAMRAGKPLIAAKLGLSDAAVRATASHTGALAGSYQSYQAMFEHYGIVVGRDVEEMVDLANGFLTNVHRLPKGNRIGICTGSGGAGAWMADACTLEGLEIPELDAKARAEIDAYLPRYGTSQNPVDGTAQAIHDIGYAELAWLVSKADNVDGVIMVTTARRKNGYQKERDNIFRVARECEKPIACWSYTLPHPTSAELFAEAGYPLHTNMRNCARTMAALVRYGAFREALLASPETDGSSPAPDKSVRAALESSGTILCEYEAKRILAPLGIGKDAGNPVTDEDAAARAAADAGGPVALKIQSPDIPHKSDAGGVALALSGPGAAREAYSSMMKTVSAAHPKADIRGVLVEPMAPKGVEVILGVSRDPTFGPLLMVGLGGIFVEILEDVAFAPVPLNKASARALVNRLKGAALLEGVRGEEPSDIDALIQTIVALSQFAADHADLIAEIDLNPVIVHMKGEGVSIADALIIKQS